MRKRTRPRGGRWAGPEGEVSRGRKGRCRWWMFCSYYQGRAASVAPHTTPKAMPPMPSRPVPGAAAAPEPKARIRCGDARLRSPSMPPRMPKAGGAKSPPQPPDRAVSLVHVGARSKASGVGPKPPSGPPPAELLQVAAADHAVQTSCTELAQAYEKIKRRLENEPEAGSVDPKKRRALERKASLLMRAREILQQGDSADEAEQAGAPQDAEVREVVVQAGEVLQPRPPTYPPPQGPSSSGGHAATSQERPQVEPPQALAFREEHDIVSWDHFVNGENLINLCCYAAAQRIH